MVNGWFVPAALLGWTLALIFITKCVMDEKHNAAVTRSFLEAHAQWMDAACENRRLKRKVGELERRLSSQELTENRCETIWPAEEKDG